MPHAWACDRPQSGHKAVVSLARKSPNQMVWKTRACWLLILDNSLLFLLLVL